MCGSKKKTETTTSTQTTTPNNPSWLEPQLQGLAGQISNLAGQDPSSFVAPTNGLLTQAGQNASSISPNNATYDGATSLFQALMNTGNQSVNAASLLDNLQSYMSPYTNDVVKAALDNYDYTAGQTRAQSLLDMAKLGEDFGGSSRFITEPVLNSQLAMGRASLDAGLRDEAFKTGANLSNLDAARRQDASLANANLIEQALARQQQAGRDVVNTANAQQTAATNAASTQANIGSILQQIQQQQASAPLGVLGQLSGMYSGLSSPLSLLRGETTDAESTKKTKESGGLGGLLGTLGSLGMALGTGGLGAGLSGGLLGQLGSGSLAGLSGFGAGLNLTPIPTLTAGG